MITPELVREIPLFALLADEHVAFVAMRAADVRLRAGDFFVHEGEAPAFYALLQGRFEILKRYGATSRQLAIREPGEYLGDVPIVLGSPWLVNARALEPVRLFRLEARDFRYLLRASEPLAKEVLAVTMQRLAGLQEESTIEDEIPLVIGDQFDSDCHVIREFLARNNRPFDWQDASERLAAQAGGADDITTFPAVVLPGGRVLLRPTLAELGSAVALSTKPQSARYDVAIIGGGPAGLAAAVYGASEGLRTLLIERYATGGQAGTSSRIENYLGFPSGLSGSELAERAQAQAERFGAEIVVGRGVRLVEPGDPHHRITFDDGTSLEASAIVVATGVDYRTLDVPGLKRHLGAGVYYGAARSEALAMRDREIVLVGGGNSAGQAAMFFANYARNVTILCRAPNLANSMSQYLIDEIATKENIVVRAGGEIVDAEGGDRLEAVVIADRASGTRERVPVEAVFVFIGADAITEWLPARVIRDARGYLCTGRDVLDLVTDREWPLERDPYLLETSVPGVFAVGDVRHGSIKRVAAGVGEGSMAIAFVHQFLKERQPAPATPYAGA